MSFLQVGALLALPLIVTPLLIHWLHRRRHPSLPWAAMMFLHRATPKNRRPAKLRRWLILATRVLVISALILAFARPLTSGAFGLAASKVADQSTNIILLDRSPSMQRRIGDRSRLQAAKQTIAATLKTLDARKIVLIDSVGGQPRMLADPNSLLERDAWGPTGARADSAEMIQQAVDYLTANQIEVADIWLASDRSRADWALQSSRWETLSDSLEQLGSGIRWHLIDFESDDSVNASVRVTQTRVESTERGRAVRLSVRVDSEDRQSSTIPVTISTGGPVTQVEVPLADGTGELRDVMVPVDDTSQPYGRVSIPADGNPSDNVWYFVGPQPSPLPVAMELDRDSAAARLPLAVIIEVLAGQITSLGNALDRQPAAIIWQKNLPTDEQAERLKRFLDEGGTVVFLPPAEIESDASFQGIRWQNWSVQKPDQENVSSRFRNVPFSADRVAPIRGELLELARSAGDEVIIGSKRVGKGIAWFCGMDLALNDAFMRDGVVLYGLLAEAFRPTDTASGEKGSWIAGDPQLRSDKSRFSRMKRRSVVEQTTRLPIEFGFHPGVFEVADATAGEQESGSDDTTIRRIAINPAIEDNVATPVSEQQLATRLPGLQTHRVTARAQLDRAEQGFAREAWGLFWILVVIGLLSEAWLCLPRVAKSGVPGSQVRGAHVGGAHVPDGNTRKANG
jgi:hypothetical protein